MESSFRYAAATIILLVPMFVNGAGTGDHLRFRSLKEFSDYVAQHGEQTTMDAGRAKVLELAAGRQVRDIEVSADDESADGFDHGCEVLLDEQAKASDHILLRVGRMTSQTHSESYYFDLTQQGLLQRITLVSAEYKDGKAVRGSGHFQNIELNARGIRKMLQHELDFWLKGMYRKKNPAAK